MILEFTGFFIDFVFMSSQPNCICYGRLRNDILAMHKVHPPVFLVYYMRFLVCYVTLTPV